MSGLIARADFERIFQTALVESEPSGGKTSALVVTTPRFLAPQGEVKVQKGVSTHGQTATAGKDLATGSGLVNALNACLRAQQLLTP